MDDATNNSDVNIDKAKKKAKQVYEIMLNDLKEQHPHQIVDEHHRSGRLAGEVGFMVMSHGLELAAKGGDPDNPYTSVMSGISAFIAALASAYSIPVEQALDQIMTHFLGKDVDEPEPTKH